MMPYISVIVPVFNTEKYVAICIESILKQTYKNIEVILVDDGSTDSSGIICDEYGKRDTRVKVVHTENNGLVAARKKGVSCAGGEYIGFVDSDDWILENTFEELKKLLQEDSPDVLCYGMKVKTAAYEYDRVNGIGEGRYEGKDLDHLYKSMLFDMERDIPGIHQSACTKLFKSFLLKNILKSIDNRITYGEDAAIVYNCCLHAKKIIVCNKLYYCYRIHKDSMCNKDNPKAFEKVYLFYKFMCDCLSSYDQNLNLEKQLKLYIMHLIRISINCTFGMNCSPMYQLAHDVMPINEKIILYGAGNVGMAYYEQLKRQVGCEIVHWVDKGKAGIRIQDKVISSLDVIKSAVYDKILIAVKQERNADEIKMQLINMGIEKEKIIWVEPLSNEWNWRIDI